MNIAATVMIAPGAPTNVELAGALPSYLPGAIFRESLKGQLTVRGFRLVTADVTTGYGVISHDYQARLTIAALAQMKAAEMRGQVEDAAISAGSYDPTCTITSIGETAQPKLEPGAIDDLLGGLARAPGNLFGSVNLIVIGLVVIVGLVAFGPNIKDIARRV